MRDAGIFKVFWKLFISFFANLGFSEEADTSLSAEK
jgi:hypothetical protein